MKVIQGEVVFKTSYKFEMIDNKIQFKKNKKEMGLTTP